MNTILMLCSLYGAYDCDLVQAISWVETRQKNTTVMDRGSLSYGPMQIKCNTSRLKTLKYSLKYGCDQLREEKVSIRFGIYYLNYQIERYGGKVRDAISAYNMGTTTICKNYNPGHCYPGEHYNYKYVNNVWRRYAWLKRKKQELPRKFLTLSRDTDTSEKFQTGYKLAFLTLSEVTKFDSMALRLKPLQRYQKMEWYQNEDPIPLIKFK